MSKCCLYHFTIVAEERNEQEVRCKEKPTRILQYPYDPGEDGLSDCRFVPLDLCESHYKQVDEWFMKED